MQLTERERQFILVSTAMEIERKAEQAEKMERTKGRRMKGRRR
jgi:hypothetical protein